MSNELEAGNVNVLTSQFGDRIEPVSDPEVNKKLFTIYAALIKPFKQMEDDLSQIELIKRNNAELALYDHPVNPIKVIILGVLLVAIGFGIGSFGFSIAGDNRTLETIFLVIMLFLMQASFLLAYLILRIAEYWKVKKENDEAIANNNKVIKQLEAESHELSVNLSKVAYLIPQKYRCSTALKYFCESYSNSRVDNLKEAVNAYDTWEHRVNELNLLAEVRDAIYRQTEMMTTMNDTLDFIAMMSWL